MGVRVVVVGSANTDLVCRVPALPAAGETVLGGRFFEAPGGKGANQAVAAARLGGEVTFVARLGADAYGDRALAGYRADGIDPSAIARDGERASGVALILVADDGENSIAVAPGANAALSPGDVAAADFAGADVVLMQLEVPLNAVAEAARRGRDAGALVILNPAPAPSEPLPRALLANVDVLTPNETEAARLGASVDGDAAAIATALRGLGVPTVVLTRGGRGALWVTRDDFGEVPAPAVDVVDTTAAGDAFNGALGVALGEGRSLPEAVAWACSAGALAATREGAQPSLPQREELGD